MPGTCGFASVAAARVLGYQMTESPRFEITALACGRLGRLDHIGGHRPQRNRDDRG